MVRRTWVLKLTLSVSAVAFSSHTMDEMSSVIAALDAGKLPSQSQLNAFIDWTLLNIIPTDSSQLDELSQPGRAIANSLADVLATYKQLGSNKNCELSIFVSPCLVERHPQMITWSKTPSGICPRATCLRPTSKPPTPRRRPPI